MKLVAHWLMTMNHVKTVIVSLEPVRSTKGKHKLKGIVSTVHITKKDTEQLTKIDVQ